MLLLLSLVLVACGQSAASSPSASSSPLNLEATQGQKLFKRECGSCHSLDEGIVIVGPSLKGIAARAQTRVDGQDARTYIKTSLLSPCEYLVEGFDCLMPQNFDRKLTSEGVDAIIAFLLTLE